MWGVVSRISVFCGFLGVDVGSWGVDCVFWGSFGGFWCFWIFVVAGVLCVFNTCLGFCFSRGVGII